MLRPGCRQQPLQQQRSAARRSERRLAGAAAAGGARPGGSGAEGAGGEVGGRDSRRAGFLMGFMVFIWLFEDGFYMLFYAFMTGDP